MEFEINQKQVSIDIEKLIIAGWTGRNLSQVEHHIKELESIGISAPSTTPLFYQCSSQLLTQIDHIQTLGNASSGEVEPFVLMHDGELFLGLASDHTDRDLETYSVAYSKQICAKPVAKVLWNWDDIKSNLDSIQLSSWIKEKDQWVLYQQGELNNILPLDQLIQSVQLKNNQAMLCGTLGAIGGVRAASEFRMQMHDVSLNRMIEKTYTTQTLDIVI